MKTVIKILWIVFLLCPVRSQAQKENSYWYFGDLAGVQFINNTVVVQNNGRLSSNEGCATISDTSGKLLFYTDGTNVWNNQHLRMPNGSGLKGNSSSTQSAMIVRKPNSMHIYYIITVNGISGMPTYGAYYSIVDMRLDGNKGDIVTNKKNILLQATTDEKITAVIHANNHDIWLLIPERNPNIINTYFLGDTGIQMSPVVSATKAYSNGTVGYLRVSPDGKRIGMAAYYPTNTGYIMYGDFNYTTGKITNTDTIHIEKPYGIEFSPNSQYLYVSFENTVLGLSQYDLRSGNKNAIKSSRYDLIKNYGSYVGSLYMGINKKIYFTFPGKRYLGCIEAPDQAKGLCNLNLNAVNLNGGTGRYGLQNCLYSLPRKRDLFFRKSFVNCQNRIDFYLNDYDYVSKIYWQFNDSNSNQNNDSVFKPSHLYSKPIISNVRAIVVLADGKKDTLEKQLDIGLVPAVNLVKCSKDTLFKCPSDYLSFGCSYKKVKYLWGNGDTGTYFFSQDTGKYHLTITDSNGCLHQQEYVIKDFKPSINIGADVTICENDSIAIGVLNPSNYLKVKWNTGDSVMQLMAYPNRRYSVIGTDRNHCVAFDTLTVRSKPLPFVQLGRDTAACKGYIYHFQLKEANTIYTLNGVTVSGEMHLDSSAQYILKANKDQCYANDTINIRIIPIPEIDLGADDSVCMDGSIQLDAGIAKSYLWQSGSTSRYQTVHKEGQYWVLVSNDQCTSADTVQYFLKAASVFIPNAFTPNDDGENDQFGLNHKTRIHRLQVFNAWGELVFSSDNEAAQWDGTFKGEVCQQGVYMVVVSYWDCQHRIQYSKEALHLLR